MSHLCWTLRVSLQTLTRRRSARESLDLSVCLSPAPEAADGETELVKLAGFCVMVRCFINKAQQSFSGFWALCFPVPRSRFSSGEPQLRCSSCLGRGPGVARGSSGLWLASTACCASGPRLRSGVRSELILLLLGCCCHWTGSQPAPAKSSARAQLVSRVALLVLLLTAVVGVIAPGDRGWPSLSHAAICWVSGLPPLSGGCTGSG